MHLKQLVVVIWGIEVTPIRAQIAATLGLLYGHRNPHLHACGSPNHLTHIVFVLVLYTSKSCERATSIRPTHISLSVSIVKVFVFQLPQPDKSHWCSKIIHWMF